MLRLASSLTGLLLMLQPSIPRLSNHAQAIGAHTFDQPALAIVFDRPDLDQLRKLSESAGCSVGWLVRRAVKFWLESADAKGLKDGR